MILILELSDLFDDTLYYYATLCLIVPTHVHLLSFPISNHRSFC